MHRSMCLTNPERDCRMGGRGACRRCPHKRRSAADDLRSLAESWARSVLFDRSSIEHVPLTKIAGRSVRAATRDELDRRIAAAEALTAGQHATIARMSREAPNDIAAAAGCTADDAIAFLYTLAGEAA